MNVKAETWKLRVMYLFFFSSMGAFIPYLSLLLEARGFQPENIGLLLSISPFVGIFFPPLWGMLADKLGRAIPLIRVQLFVLPILVYFFYHATEHLQIIGLLIVVAIFLNAFAPLADHVTLEYVQADGVDYGRVRVFGSIGFSLTNLVVSLFLLRHSPTLLYEIYIPTIWIALASTVWIRERHRTKQSFSTHTSIHPSQAVAAIRSHQTRHFRTTFKNHLMGLNPFWGFYLTIFVISTTIPVYNSFFPLYMKELHFSSALIPIAFLLSSGSEILTMPFATKLYAQLGIKRMLILSALAYALRWLVVSQFSTPSLLIGIQLLHGVAFGFFYTSCVMYVRSVMPKALYATGQGVFAATTAMGNVVGNVVGGSLYEHLAPHIFFLVQMGIALFSAALYAVYRFPKNPEEA